jgi:hypothetical protein
MAFPKPDYATKNMKLVGHSDQDGRCDGVQIMLPNSTAHLLVNRRSLRNRDKAGIIQQVREMLAGAAPSSREAEPLFGHI